MDLPSNERHLYPLHFSGIAGCYQCAKELLEANATLNMDPSQESPLDLAIVNNHTEVAELIFIHLEDKNPVTNSGASPLHFAALMGHFDLFDFMTTHGTHGCPRMNGLTEEILDGQTPMHVAAALGHLNIVELYVRKNFCQDPNPGLPSGETPMHQAAAKGHVEIVNFLMENVDDQNPLANPDGLTPFHYAVTEGQFEVVKVG